MGIFDDVRFSAAGSQNWCGHRYSFSINSDQLDWLVSAMAANAFCDVLAVWHPPLHALGHQSQLRALLPQQGSRGQRTGVWCWIVMPLAHEADLGTHAAGGSRLRREHPRQVVLAHGREPGEEVLYLADWTLLETNVLRTSSSEHEVLVLLRRRWQIELLFKL